MATFVDSKYSAAFCTLLGSLSVAFSDVVSVSCLVIHIYFFMESFNYVEREPRYSGAFFYNWYVYVPVGILWYTDVMSEIFLIFFPF